MYYQIIEIFKNQKVLIANFSYLAILNLFNMIFPLVTYPYLIRVLGTSIYGRIIFAQAIVGYLVIFVSFGFNIYATKEISINRNNIEKLSEIVSSVFIVKGGVFLVSMIVLTFLLKFMPEAQGFKELFYLTMWMCLYELLFPIFYFQGIEKMKYITYLNLISRVIFLFSIFIFVKSKDDYLKVPLINGIGATISGLISIILLTRDHVKFKFQSFSLLFTYLKNSYVMALAFLSNALKSNLNIIIVKLFFSYSEVAYFDLALKISNLFTTFLDLISQTIFPKMAREKNVLFFKKILKLSLVLSLTLIVFVQLFSSLIIETLGGKEMLPTVILLRILVFYIPIYIIGALLGRNWLIIHGYDKQVLLSMLYSSIFYLSLLAFFYLSTKKISLIALVLIFIASYIFETLYRYTICRFKKIL